MKTYRVLAPDGFHEAGVELLERENIEIDLQKRTLDEVIEKLYGGYDVLVVRSRTEVNKEVFKAGLNDLEYGKSSLKIVARAGVGYDNIDIEAANKYRVVVTNAPQESSNSVAEFTIFLMGSLARNIPQAHHDLGIKNRWDKGKYSGFDVREKTLGIIGVGNIGTEVAKLAQGLGMKVIGYDIKQYHSDIHYVELDDLLKQSDFVTVHVTGDVQVMTERELKLMKKSAYLINAARATCVDEKALLRALEENWIAGAAIDVYHKEPKKEGEKFENPFEHLDNVMQTPHIAASTDEAQAAIATYIASNLILRLNGYFENPDDASIDFINLEPIRSEHLSPVWIWHKDVEGMLGKFGTIMAEGGINLTGIPVIKTGIEGEALALCQAESPPKREVLDALRQIEGVYRVAY